MKAIISLRLKAISDETRIKILELLLGHNYCVGALARNLNLTEATVSQHLKVLREAGLLVGEKRGYFMHYRVNRTALTEVVVNLAELLAIETKTCEPGTCESLPVSKGECASKGKCDETTKEFCHGKDGGNNE